MKLFHDAMKPRMVAATMPGLLSGSTIRTKVPTREQPSIRAALLELARNVLEEANHDPDHQGEDDDDMRESRYRPEY